VLTRAWATLEIKAVDEEQRIITGIATSATPDRQDDIVEPAGAQFDLPIALLWQHDSRSPIGEVFAAKQVGNHIEIQARIAKVDEPGLLKDRLDLAWQSVKAKLVRGLSIGFKSLEDTYDRETGGMHFLRWLWLELSLVTIPANADANIQTIRSLDVGLAAPGTLPARPSLPGVTGVRVVRTTPQGSRMAAKKAYADLVAGCVATRKEKTDRIDAILQKNGAEGVTMTEVEEQEHDTLAEDVVAIDKQLKRYRDAEAREKAEAVDVTARGTLEARPGARILITRELPKGILFARHAMCIGAAKGIHGEALRLAKQYYPDDPGIQRLIEKAAVAGGATSGSHWLDDMVPYNIMQDFIEYLRPGSIIGKFGAANPGGGPNYPSLNRVGFNERVSGMSTGFSAGWKGEGLPAIPSAAVTFNTSLTWNCLAALAILTKEAIRFSNPNAEARVRDDIARAVNYKMDLDFVDPAKAVSGTTSPASITHGIVATTPTGTTAAYFRTNLATMLKLFTTNFLGTNGIVLIMSESMALELSMMINTLGNEDFPNINAMGGSVRGIPVITSEALSSVGSPSTQTIVAVKAPEVYLADDGVVTVEASDQASIEMQDSSAQSGISGTGASLVSLWQNGLVGLLANREVTWKLRRSTAVQYISPAAYSA
jgi:HK97 family phage prohead protease/HK97 family phage major capsid protein